MSNPEEKTSNLTIAGDQKNSQPPSPLTDVDSQTSEMKTEEKPTDSTEGTRSEPPSSTGKPEREECGNCGYCGKERNLNIIELLCANCNKWFHESCIGYQLGKLVPFMLNYVFVCKNCSNTGLESFKKNPPVFPQICVTAIANLMQTSIKEGSPRTQFSKDKDIIPFIESHWEGITTFAKRVKQSMYSAVVRALVKETNVSFHFEEHPEDGPVYSLIQQDLTQIKPNYEAMIKQGQLKVTDMGVQHGNRISYGCSQYYYVYDRN